MATLYSYTYLHTISLHFSLPISQGATVRARGEIKYLADNVCLCLLDNENLLVFGPTPLGYFYAIDKGRSGAVPEPLSGILQHGSVNMFGIFAGLMFIEDIEHAAKHFAAGVLRYLLRDRNKLHADLAKLADIKFRMERVAAEPAQRMNQDEVERMIGFPGGEDHG